MIRPISPSEVVNKKQQVIPEIVITVFNELIAKYWNGRESKIMQDEILSEITNRSDLTADVIMKNHYLDVETIYRENGWKVFYDAPGYCEPYYKESFTFSKKEL